MPVPTYDQFIEPLLRVLAQHPDGMAARQAADGAAAALGVTEEQKQELLPSGAQPIYRNRAGWAHDRLKRAGLSSSPRRGSWQITQAGREFLERQPQPLPAEVARELAMGYVDVRLRPAAEAGGEVSSAAVASPDDRLGEALQELRQAAEAELLELLDCMPWATAPAAVICSGWVAPVMAASMG
jgi:restriction system protein